jgi:hypothetical protein
MPRRTEAPGIEFSVEAKGRRDLIFVEPAIEGKATIDGIEGRLRPLSARQLVLEITVEPLEEALADRDAILQAHGLRTTREAQGEGVAAEDGAQVG